MGVFSRGIRQLVPSVLAIIAASAYGLATHLAFRSISITSGSSGPLTMSFFFGMPLILGGISVAFAPREYRNSLGYVLFMPWIPVTLCFFVAALLQTEFLVCLALAWWIYLPLASVGGYVGFQIWGDHGPNGGQLRSLIPLFVLVPFLSSQIEARFPMQQEMRRVHSFIDIAAPQESVWQQITNLREIGPDEQRFAVFHLMGLPRPIEAKMACEEVGCVRRGQWEDGLAFNGYITDLEPGQKYWVRLEADTSQVHSATAPLAAVGSPTFGMVDDGYEIEPLSDGRSRLHLYSTYRVKTGINAYATVWLDFLMRDIQGYILNVEKARAERG